MCGVWEAATESSRALKLSHSYATPATEEAPREVEGGSRPLPTAGSPETLRPAPGRPGAAGPALSTRARSSQRRRGRGLPGASPPAPSQSLGSGCRSPAPAPRRRMLRAFGDPRAPRAGPCALPPGSTAAPSRCFQTCCAWIWGQEPGREPRRPGGCGRAPRSAGMRQGGARLRGLARCGGLEQGVCRLRSWRRALVPAALPRGGTKDVSSP